MSFTFFKAYSLLSVILRTLYTDEYAPSPVFKLHLPSRLISWKSLSDINWYFLIKNESNIITLFTRVRQCQRWISLEMIKFWE